MEEKAIEIIDRSIAYFMRFGLRAVSMDEIARELGISKKTLYKYFKDKNDLIVQGVQMKIKMDEKSCENSTSEGENAIDELFKISEFVIQSLSNLNQSVLFELKKFHPEAWQIMHNHKWEFVYRTIKTNIDRGVAEGIYRENLNPEIIARLYVGSTDMIMESEVFPWPEFKLDNVYLEVLKFQVRGLANEKGITYLQTKMNNL
jgi:AcrR family transcriptional regulator